MKILINCSTLKKGGVLQVAHSFVSELVERSDHEYCFIFSPLLRKDFQGYKEEDELHFHTYDVNPTMMKALTGRDKTLDRIFAKVKPDIVFSLFGPTYWKPKSAHVCGYAKAVYFYPDSPFIQNMPLLRKLKLKFLKVFHMNDFKNFNDALITETNDASFRLSKILPQKNIYTVSNTYNQIFDNPQNWDTNVKLPTFDGITLLTITANYRHKNLSVIPKVAAYLSNKYPSFKFRFVLTLREGEIEITDKNMLKYMVFLGRVSIYQCPTLYKKSDLMFMPTLLECFSATYPEAMKMETPILTSDMPFARDVCGDAAIYFDPLSPESIGEAIYGLATDKAMISELRSKGKKRLSHFNDSKARTQKYIEIIEKTYETNHPTHNERGFKQLISIKS